MMDGGTDVDNNAVLFAKGAHEVFDPLVKEGKVTIKAEAVVKGWDVNNAAPTFTQALTKAKAVDGVLAANDDIANAVITVLQKNGAAGKVPVTGQDAGIGGLQNILKGDQCMTVFKDVKQEADAAAKLAIALINGDDPSSVGELQDFEDPESSSHDIQALLLTPQVITKDNVQDVVDAGALKASDICDGIQDLCDAAGVK
jgi:D-xylose transport system substrate-binding protein